MDKNRWIGKVIPLADSIAYSSDAVVSKTLLNSKAGTLTLFAFDQGQGLSEHTAPFDATVQILDGEAEIRIDQTTHKVHPGQMLIMPAGIPHELKAEKPFKMLLIMIRERKEPA